MAHEIVVLGANFAGINITHALLRQTIPSLTKLDPSQSYHVTLVSPNANFFFKVGTPRTLVKPEQIPVESLFKSIPEAIKQYGEACTFLQAKAVGLKPQTRTVEVEVNGGGKKELKYHSLFICTGTTSASPLWTVHDDEQISAKLLKETHARLPSVKTVLIAGAGPVGFETTGEIAAQYPGTKITLVAAGEVLPKLNSGMNAKAKKFLDGAKVEVLTNTRVNSSSSSGTSTTIELSNGQSKTVDLYIDARGAHKVNSEYLPQSWLDSTGRVNTRDAYFRVKGDGSADVSNVYVMGDIVAGAANTALELDAQVPTAASSFAVDVAAKLGKPTGGSGGLLSFIPGLGSKGISQTEFKPMKETIFVPFGPGGGIGQAMGWGLPSFMVKKGKAEKFLMELVEPAISGTKYPKA